MLRIGEAAKKFNVSNRTLRYWEESGILKSSRAENGYRYYDDENSARINQIVLLRNLKMPIPDIERFFMTADLIVAIDALNVHLENLKRDAVACHALIVVVEKIIRQIKEDQNFEQLFSYLEIQTVATDSRYMNAPQIRLSERKISLLEERLNNFRIVRLPSMTVAAYRAESETPEDDCSKIINKFVLDNSLHKKSGFRHFGFNNPSPSTDSPVYGYEMWVTIPDGITIPEPMEKRQFWGGLYVSIPTSMNDITERWQQLSRWVENSSDYVRDSNAQCLEECIDFETFITGQSFEQQLDLLEPIKRRGK